MEGVLETFCQSDEATQPGGQGTLPDGGRKRRRAAAEASLSALNAHDYPTDSRWTPYDPSEMVIATSEVPSQRYPLVHQSCLGKDGLDYALLRKSGILCSETLIKDMYKRIVAMDERIAALTKDLDHKVKNNVHLQSRLNYFVQGYVHLLKDLNNVCTTKLRAEKSIAEYEKTLAISSRHVPETGEVCVASGADMDTHPLDIDDDVSAGTGDPELCPRETGRFHVRVLGKHMLKVHISGSRFVEKPLHALHILPVDSSSDIEGIYYFQKQFLDITNALLPKRFKVSSIGAWNYTMRNLKTEDLQRATWDDSIDAKEARDLAKGPKGVILLTQNTLKDVIDNLTDRTQDEKKWERVPDRARKQTELKHKTEELVTQFKTMLDTFRSLMESNRDELDDLGA